ncbi:hypothetical protein BDV59DRAFT_205455 [Aspergillus ambiguus]|uniref:uncharacterized protein n=1 Tax=Aspergillus ambiguus TaxID=176160 RepID=UPI003CCD307C
MPIKATLVRALALMLLSSTLSSAMSFDKYTEPVPEGLVACDTREQLGNAVPADYKGETALFNEDGGYFLKDVNTGERLAVATDALVDSIDAQLAEMDTLDAAGKLKSPSPEPQTSPNKRDGNLGEAANACQHWKCQTDGICKTYNDCHVCLTSKKWCI